VLQCMELGRRFRGRDEKSRTFKKVGVSLGGGSIFNSSRISNTARKMVWKVVVALGLESSRLGDRSGRMF
jgi:hypothetical protein